MAFGGYVFESPVQLSKFNEEWASALQSASIAYFRMSEFANGTGEASRLSRDDRSDLVRRLIGIIKRRAGVGAVVGVSTGDFNSTFNQDAQAKYGGMYTLGTQLCLSCIERWCDERQIDADIAYVFEAGHPSQTEASRYLNIIGGDARYIHLKKRYRYGSHTFGEKRLILPTQAADLLAWQWRKHLIRRANHQCERLDFASLLQHATKYLSVSKNDLEEMLMNTSASHREVLARAGYPDAMIQEFISRALPANIVP